MPAMAPSPAVSLPMVLRSGLLAAPALTLALLGATPLIQPAGAQQQGYGQTLGTGLQERELTFGTGPNRSGGLLDTSNPIELMNRMRRGTAMDDATPPGDAVDAALKDFQRQAATPKPGGSTLSPKPTP